MSKKQITNYKFSPGGIPPAFGQYPNAVALLTENRAFLIAEMDQYIRNQITANSSNSGSPYYNYSYTTTRSNKCQRDTGYIIDSIIYDLTYGGNSAIYQIAQRFYVNGILQVVTPAVEVDTHTWLRNKITTNILTNTTYTKLNTSPSITQVIRAGNNAESGAITTTTTEYNVVINAINVGLSSLPTAIVPNSQGANLAPDTVTLLDANKRFIQEEAIAYIQYNVANNISPYAYYTYDAAKCRRDVSYILDGYLNDIKHGGNKKTVNYASKYFEGGIPQVDGNRLPEVYAHTFIKDLIENYILVNVTFTARQTAVPQVINNSVSAEVFGTTLISILSGTVIDVIANGLTSVPPILTNQGTVKFPGFYKLKDLLLITNTSRNTILYNFADPATAAQITYSGDYDSDFPGALYGNDKITTVTFDVDTTGMMITDQIQIFVEGKEQTVRLNPIATDAMERMKVGIPQSMLDADFEYGLQPTKWQTVSMMRNYPSVYEIPGSDLPVTSVVTDASNGTSGVGASQITVTTVAAHGFSVGDVFTIKALAASVLGFSRAEGTFLVASVTSSVQFTYYAKSKVGTANPTTLSQTYTQLRKAGFYTGASVGTPSFNVYSNGQSGTITSSLITSTGSNFLGFSSSPPPQGAPLTGTGIAAGTQITAVVGNGGTATTTQLTSTAVIGDTQIIVSSTAGILPGLVFNRGDGVAVQVLDVTSNTVTLSGSLTSGIIGTNQTYLEQNGTASPAGGTGATFAVSRTSGAYTAVVGSSNGQGYTASDTITILGSNLGGSSPTNDATITVIAAAPKNTVVDFDPTTLNVGSGGYADATGVVTVGGTGAGLTVDITTLTGVIQTVAVNNPGSGYTVGDAVTIAGGNGDAVISILTVSPGGDIQTFTIGGTPATAPSVGFTSAITLSDFTTSNISNASTAVSYTSIPTIEVAFLNAHGFVPGDSITIAITSTDTNAQLAAGAYYVEQTPTTTSLRYTARAPGIIANTLTGIVYSRPDSYYVHRPYDGGVQLGTGGPAHGATAIRMSKKYIRYQSGKGVMYNTGALFAPSYDIQSMTTTGTAINSVITLVNDDTDHGCQVGAQITINGVTTTGVNGVYTVASIINERSLTVRATQVLGSSTIVLGDPCFMSVLHWHGSTIRSGTFDDQNGMFWQYDGIRMAVVKRSSANHVAGTINLATDSNLITGTNTRFTQQLAAGDRVVIKGMSHVVSQIVNDTTMYVTPDYRGVNNLVGGKLTKTIDTVIPQENWNLDALNGSGPSGYNIDVTKMQMIGMQWTWYGAGFIDFMLRGSEGNYTFAHRFRNSNVNQEAYMRSGNQPVRYEVINEGAKDKLSSAIDASQTTIPLNNAYWFPSAGTVIIEAEMIRYTGNDGLNLTGCVRGTSLSQFVAGSTRTFSGGAASTHSSGSGVILISNTITPIISHWGSAFMIDGQFDSDRGYLFNYASTGITVSTDKQTAFLIRLAPSVSNAQTGDLGDKELLNRAQLLLQNVTISSDAVSGNTGGIVVEGVLNPQNYPTDPTKITWTGLASSAAGGQPSFAQVAAGGSVAWSGNFSTATATVQGAFTTTLTATSFAPSTNSLTAVGFNVVTQTAAATSFAAGTSATYNSALSTARNDFLIPMTTYTALQAQTPLAVGDTISATTYITGGQTITGLTPNYTTLASVAYARITMSAVANATSPTAVSNGAQNITVTFTSSVAATFASALSTARSTFLITQTQYASSAAAITDVLSTATYLTGSQTISARTPNYTTIAGVSYALIQMSSAANATSTAGSSNSVSVTATSAATATYGSALSTARTDFLVTDAAWAAAGLLAGDGLSVATYITGGQTISSVQTGYVTINATSYTRVVMTAVANATSTSGLGNNVTVTVTAAGSSASYVKNNYLFFTSTSWLATNATLGTKIATDQTSFPAGTSVAAVSTRTFGATTVYRVTFTQTSNTTISAAGTLKFQFGAAYALPGEQVFSFISNPGNVDNLDLSGLKELTSTSIGGRGTFPNGPDVLAINVYKTAGTSTIGNVILRWGEAQA